MLVCVRACVRALVRVYCVCILLEIERARERASARIRQSNALKGLVYLTIVFVVLRIMAGL